MKILMLFIDALRVDQLSTYNDKVKKDTIVDKYINRMKGEVFINCFTSSPDTYRSLASLFTGINSSESNCNSYSKPLGGFGEDYHTIWDEAINNKFNIDMFHSSYEKYIFPRSIQQNISNEIDLRKFKEQLKLKNNHIVWIGLNDYRHHSYYSKYNHKKNDENINTLKKPLDLIDSDFLKEFDHIFMFSDHGILFDNEFLAIDSGKKFGILDHRRTQLLMVYKNSKEDSLSYNDKLYYLSDMNYIIRNLIKNIDDRKKLDREYLIVEDMDFSSMDLSSAPSLFSLITKDEIYIRSFLQKIGTSNSVANEDKAFLLDRKTLNGNSINILPDKEKILCLNNNFTYIYKIYNFWMNQKIINDDIQEKLKIPEKSDLDSMGNPITYTNQFSLLRIATFFKEITPPILFYFIKKIYKRILS